MKTLDSLKWQKYLLLVQHELTTTDRLSREVLRYTWNQWQHLLEHLDRRYRVAELMKDKILCVIIFVKSDAVRTLPNYRIHSKSDIKGLRELIHKNDQEYNEIWCCETQINPSQLSVAGRVLFQDAKPEIAQHVEQLWHTSPRLIEEMVLSNKESPPPFSFVRAYRPSWGWSYRIDFLHAHSKSKYSASIVEREFYRTMILLERERYRIERFLEFIYNNGASSVTLEFKADADTLWFIDWDTAIDRHILAKACNDSLKNHQL